MSALVIFLTMLDNYALKQTFKKHKNRGIKYWKTRGLEQWRKGGGLSAEGGGLSAEGGGLSAEGGGLSAEGREDMFYGQLLLVLYSD